MVVVDAFAVAVVLLLPPPPSLASITYIMLFM